MHVGRSKLNYDGTATCPAFRTFLEAVTVAELKPKFVQVYVEMDATKEGTLGVEENEINVRV